MPLALFRVPETRLLAVNDLVVQVTLTFRTDEDEELHHRYKQDPELQALVQTAVVSLVNCGYTSGVAKGPGFLLHQLRKKWPIGRRYIFTKNGEPMHSSLHKYFFQLEFVDDAELQQQQQQQNRQQASADTPVLEIVELRGVGMSPSASSYNGSTIEGLDSVMLPPMSAIFGQGSPLLQGSEAYGHRRSGSGHSSTHSALLHRPQSPYLDYHERRPESVSSRRSVYESEVGRDSLSHSYAGASQAGDGMSRVSNLYQDASSASEHYRNAHAAARASVVESVATAAGPSSVSQYVQYYAPRHSIDGQARSGAGEGNTSNGMDTAETLSPVTVAMRTRSVSRSSVGSANGSVHTIQSVSEIQASVSTTSQQRLSSNGVSAANRDASPTNGQPRLGRTSWYRSLHGISPLSRQPKSLSSENEFANNNVDSSGGNEPRIPRIAGVAPPPPASNRQAAGKELFETSALSGIAQKIKRKLLTPMHLHRNRDRRSSLSRPAPIAEGGSDFDTSDFTGPESEEGSESESRLRLEGSAGTGEGSAANNARLAANDRRPASTAASSTYSMASSTSASAQVSTPKISRPDMPPPSTRPPPRPASRGQGDLTSIPTAVKNALLRRLRSPLGGRPDKSGSASSVKDKISAFNSLSVEAASSTTSQSLNNALFPSADSTAPMSSTRSHLQDVSPTRSAKSSSAGVAHDLPPVPTVRSRIGTATGFISIATPVSAASSSNNVSGLRPQSRASSVRSTGARPVSPALSQMSNVSTRVQEAISALERAASGSSSATPRRLEVLSSAAGGEAGLAGSAKRMATGSADALDSFASPTKRPRAPSVAPDSDSTSTSRLNPIGMMRNMVRKSTGR